MRDTDPNRREVLGKIAVTGTLAGSFVGSAAARRQRGGEDSASQGVGGQAVELPDVAVDTLGQRSAEEKLTAVRDTDVFTSMNSYLEDNYGAKIDPTRVSGVEIEGESIYDHVSLTVPTRNRSNHEQLTVRIFERGEVSVQAFVDGSGYFVSQPRPGSPGDIDAQAASDEPGGRKETIVPHTQWRPRQATSGSVRAAASFSEPCIASGTFDAGGPACTFISGVAALGGAILLVIPEPSTSATGAVAIAGALTGGCQIAKALENGLDLPCEVTEVGICVTIPTPWSPTGVYAYPADCV